MPHGFWGCHFAKGGAVIPSEFYSGVPNSAGCHILCDTGVKLCYVCDHVSTTTYFLIHCGCTLFNFLSHFGCTLFNFLSHCGCCIFVVVFSTYNCYML